MNMSKFLKKVFDNLFKRSKKVVSIPQGKEYESWLGI